MIPEEREAVTAYQKYEIECPVCGSPFDIDHDPAGEEVECDACGVELFVEETR